MVIDPSGLILIAVILVAIPDPGSATITPGNIVLPSSVIPSILAAIAVMLVLGSIRVLSWFIIASTKYELSVLFSCMILSKFVYTSALSKSTNSLLFVSNITLLAPKLSKMSSASSTWFSILLIILDCVGVVALSFAVSTSFCIPSVREYCTILSPIGFMSSLNSNSDVFNILDMSDIVMSDLIKPTFNFSLPPIKFMYTSLITSLNHFKKSFTDLYHGCVGLVSYSFEKCLDKAWVTNSCALSFGENSFLPEYIASICWANSGNVFLDSESKLLNKVALLLYRALTNGCNTSSTAVSFVTLPLISTALPWYIKLLTSWNFTFLFALDGIVA